MRDMKTPYVVALVLAAVLVTVAIEEGRMSSLAKQVEESNKQTVAAAANAGAMAADDDGPRKLASHVRVEGETVEVADEDDGPDFQKTVRKMWDNPAGRSMMQQGVKIAVAMMYEDFIDSLDLTKEEEKYLKELLGAEMSAQQELGMKLMGASPEEMEELTKELAERKAQSEEDVKTFLNSDEDFAAYKKYKEQMPERQQLDGIRGTMEAKGVAMDAETEVKLVDAMHKVRTESSAPDLSGANAIKELSEGNVVERFESSWDTQQEMLMEETSGFLSAEQQEALSEQQKQMRDMQLMGLKMAERMMKPRSGDGEEEE